MDFDVSTANGSLHITIKNSILNYSHIETIRNTIKKDPSQNVILQFTNDTAVLPSSLIGTLLKLIHVDEKHITIITGNEDFVEMLKAFRLDSIMEVKKI